MDGDKEKHICFILRITNNSVRRYIDSSQIKKELDNMTGLHGWIIGYLMDNADKDVFQRDLESKFQMRRSTATMVMQVMEKNGMITRESVPYDARLKKLVLTDKAVSACKRMGDEIDRMEAHLASGITPEEMEVFNAVCKKIVKNAENE